MLGGWVNELNTRRIKDDDKKARRTDARRFLAPELDRTIQRVLYIHGRATANFLCEVHEHKERPGDLKTDFLPYGPVLYPSAPQVHDLSGDEATSLIAFYDSLRSLEEFVHDWWAREGQLSINIFNMILHSANKSLMLGLSCIEKFDLEALHPPQYEAWGSLTSRITKSISTEDAARKRHLEMAESKVQKTA